MKIAVIGTRSLRNQKDVLTNIVEYLKENGLNVHVVRSGNALGTDQVSNSFAKIDRINVIHYLPWESYNKDLQIKKDNVYYICKSTHKFDKDILDMFPHMNNMKPGIWSLIRRNFQIILGTEGNDPVDIVFWHTIDGKLTGGTRYGVMLARKLGIKDISV
jgi:hypothetical protein